MIDKTERCVYIITDEVPVEEYGKRHVFVKVSNFVSANDADKDTDNGQGREHDNGCNQARRKQELVRT